MAAAGRASPKAKTASPDLTGSALLLCAHGRSGEGAPAAGRNRPPSSEAHAAALRERRLFASVDTCVLRGRPGLADALAGIGAGRIFLVPLLMADGYTFRVVLPELLAKAGGRAANVTLCRPAGLSRALVPFTAGQAAALCGARGWPPGETGVVIAAHGTERHERSAASAERLAKRIAALRRFGSVTAAFLDQAPALEETLRDRRSSPCAVLGLFADEGSHSARDIPRLISAEHPGAAYSGALGAKPAFVEVIVETVMEAAKAPRGIAN